MLEPCWKEPSTSQCRESQSGEQHRDLPVLHFIPPRPEWHRLAVSRLQSLQQEQAPAAGSKADDSQGSLCSGIVPFMQSHHSKQHGRRWAGQDGRACAG